MPEDKPIHGMRGPLSDLRDRDAARHRPRPAALRMEIGTKAGTSRDFGDPYQTPRHFDGTDASPAQPPQGEAVQRPPWWTGSTKRPTAAASGSPTWVEEEAQPEQPEDCFPLSYTDRLGLPRPLIDDRLSEYTRKQERAKLNSAIYKAIGAKGNTLSRTRTMRPTPRWMERGLQLLSRRPPHCNDAEPGLLCEPTPVLLFTSRCCDDNLYIGSATFPATGSGQPDADHHGPVLLKTADTLANRLAK